MRSYNHYVEFIIVKNRGAIIIYDLIDYLENNKVDNKKVIFFSNSTPIDKLKGLDYKNLIIVYCDNLYEATYDFNETVRYLINNNIKHKVYKNLYLELL